MDIRDVKETVPPIWDGDGLTQMFSLQKALLEHYIGIEKMPKYPIDLHIKADQTMIKDFTGRVIEELGEAFESYSKMLELLDEKGTMLQPNELLIPHLQNFNEELSDALHFFLEILIYINFDENDIKGYYESFLKKQNLQDIFIYRDPSDTLKSAFSFARHFNANNARYIGEYKREFKVIQDVDLKDEFLRGGRIVGMNNFNEIKILMWNITYHLTIARNFLKNKPWKRSQLPTDINRFHHTIMEAWLELFNLFDFVGMTPESLFTIYWKKNKINLFRIESNY